MASARAIMGESGWYPSVVQPKRNGLDRKDNSVAATMQERVMTPPSNRSVGGGGSSTEQRFCRLCLSKEQQLKPLFPPNGTPDEGLLQRIMNCLTIALSFEEDYDKFICRICVQEVTKFFLYKEQCLANDSILRSRQKTLEGEFYDDDDDEKQDDKDSPELVEDTGEENEEEGNNWEPIDSDEFDIREDEGDPRGGASNNNSFRSVNHHYNDTLAMEPWKLKPLPRQRARRENVQDYYYGGYRYTCATSRANGRVHWRCMYKSKLKCRAAILVSPNGAVTVGPNRHNHQPDKKVPTTASHTGGTILDVHTGRYVTYRMITSQRSKIHPTQMVCDGYKYRYARTTQKQTTYWRCMKHNGKENCKAVLSFRVDFSSCSSNGHGHNHPTQYDMGRPGQSGLEGEAQEQRLPKNDSDESDDSDSNETTPNPLPTTTTATTEKMVKGKRQILLHKGFQYGFPRTERQYSKWACYKKSLFNCPANVLLNWAGKVIKESDWAHNHGPNDDYSKDALIDGYLVDAKTSEQVYYKLIPGKRGQRFILHNGFRYSSDRFMSDGRMAWKCTKCKVFIIIGGRFGTIEDRKAEHEHPTVDDDDGQFDASRLQELSMAEGEGEDGDDQDGEVKKEEFDENSLEQFDEEVEEVDPNRDELDSDDDLLIIP